MKAQQTLFETEQVPFASAETIPQKSGIEIRIDDGRTIQDWIHIYRFQSLLSELVLRAKTIEANVLHSAGPSAELEYLLGAYEGDENHLKAALLQLGVYLQTHKMPPRIGIETMDTSL